MIISRYLAKEVFSTLVAITAILMLIFLSNLFVRYLSLLAAGKLPGFFIFQLMALEIPRLLGLLLPLSLFLSIIIAYGRLYVDNEMTVLMACGMSQRRLVMLTMLFASVVAGLVAILTLWVSPSVSADRDRLFQLGKVAFIIDTLVPGRFRSLENDEKVIYVESMSRDHQFANNIFVAQLGKSNEGERQWSIVAARKGEVVTRNHQQFFVAENGHRYVGQPGQRDYRVVKFDKFGFRLETQAEETPIIHRIKSQSLSMLWAKRHSDLKYLAELQWRFSIPMMVLVLALLAISLSRTQPRQGKYANILPAILLLIVYSNMVFVMRDWVSTGKIPSYLSMWWIHIVFTLFALILLVWPKWHMRRRSRILMKSFV